MPEVARRHRRRNAVMPRKAKATADGSGTVFVLNSLAVKERSLREEMLDPVNWNPTPEPPKEVTAQFPLKI